MKIWRFVQICCFYVVVVPKIRYYNTERRQLKFKMARGQISELEVFRSLISCAFVKNWADHIWAPWRNENSILNFKKVGRNDKMDHICFDIIGIISCILGVLGEFLNILLTFWSGRKKSSRLFFDLSFALLFSTFWRYTVWLINIWKSFHMVSGTTSGLVGTKYISNWSLELYNLCLVSRIWI
jgi:hypothetical protein